MTSNDEQMARLTGRWVVRYLGEGEAPAADVALIRRSMDVLDMTPRMLLVRATPDQLERLIPALPHWSAAKERSFTLVP